MKTIARMPVVVMLLLGLWRCSLILHASPIDDLASPSQGVRDAAANILRETYSPPPRTNWDALISALKLGTPQSVIESQLRSSNFAVSGSTSFGSTDVKWYRLDDLWVLHCIFTNSMSGLTNRALDEVTLKEDLIELWVEPPSNFTGTWRTYWVNGQPSQEISYKNGQRYGESMSFSRAGVKSVVSHVKNGVTDGEEVGFYSSGRTNYIGLYKAGKQVGLWVWYKEDGSIESQKNYGP
jgi:hypothetical protein